MRNAKKMVAVGTMMVAMVFGTTLANAGIIIAGKEGSTQDQAGKEKTASGTCGETTSLTGIIIAGFVNLKTGIIIAGKDSQTRCGIIIAG
jgi:hypothetical protein